MWLLKNWCFAVSMMPEIDNCIGSLRRFFSFVDSGVKRMDFRDPLGVAGEIYGNTILSDGTFVFPAKIRRIERTNEFRGPIQSFRIIKWQLTKVNEIYRVYTDRGIYYIRLCDLSDSTKMIFDDLLEGAKKLSELREEPFRAASV